MNDDTTDFHNKIDNYYYMEKLYGLHKAYVRKRKIHFSFVFIKYSNEASVSYEEFFRLINDQLRSSDFAFMNKASEYVILVLANSKVKESKSFLGRISSTLPQLNMPLVTVIAEIANSLHSLEEVLETCEAKVLELDLSQVDPFIIPNFMVEERVKVKVSIIENDKITQSIFFNMFHQMETDHRDLEIRTFSDGLDFIESDFYLSEHNHIIVLNDILPRKNGFEVLYYLRNLPNEQKYYIIFISSRNSEDAQLYCYENGADGYFVRPFNLKIFEIKIQNYLRRSR